MAKLFFFFSEGEDELWGVSLRPEKMKMPTGHTKNKRGFSQKKKKLFKSFHIQF